MVNMKVDIDTVANLSEMKKGLESEKKCNQENIG